jgi:hypothetical protein
MWPRFKNTPNCKSADHCGWTGDRDFSLHKLTRIEEFILKNLAIKNKSRKQGIMLGFSAGLKKKHHSTAVFL